MTVQTQRQLESAGIERVSDLAQVVPGIRIDEAGPYTEPSIRGISSVVTGAGFAPNIATYLDGYYRPDPLGGDIPFSDVDSVQVLKGPQGTLFGRNSTGGAFLVTTRGPTFTPQAQVQASYGNYSEAHVSLFVAGPLSNTMAVSLSGHLDGVEGFNHNIVTGDRVGDMHGGEIHAKLLYQANNDSSITVSIDHSEVNDGNAFLYNAYQDRSDGPIFVPGSVTSSQRGQVANDGPDSYANTTTTGYLTGKFKIGAVKLVSYTGYQWIDVSKLSFDLDASSAPFGSLAFPETDHVFTQEFDLSGSTSKFDWVAGAFYMNQQQAQPFSVLEGNGSTNHISNTSEAINAYAAFADGTYKLTDNLYLTAGARYGVDDITGISAFEPTFADLIHHHTFGNVDGRVVLRYQLDPRSNIYASVSRGSKAGSFNVSLGNPAPVLPEHITAYEVGYKISRPRWHFEAAAYDYEYTDQQITEYVGNYQYFVNAQASRVYGAEGQAGLELTDEFRLDAGAAYTHGTYLRFNNAERYAFSPTSGVSVSLGNDASGNTMERAPAFSGNIGLTYHRSLAGGQFNLTGNFAYQTKINFDPFGDTFQPAYGLLNMRAAWTEPGNHWTVALYGKNVTDTKYLTQVNQETAGTFQQYGRPATYGVEVTWRY